MITISESTAAGTVEMLSITGQYISIYAYGGQRVIAHNLQYATKLATVPLPTVHVAPQSVWSALQAPNY